VIAAASAIVASWRLLSPPEPADVDSHTRAPTDSDFPGISVLPLLFGLAFYAATPRMKRPLAMLSSTATSSATRSDGGLTPWKYPSDRLASAGKEGRHETSAVQ
jgi:hypothetical protein